MSDSRDDGLPDVNPGRIPCDCFDFVTNDGLLVHADTYDLEASKRYQAELARKAEGQNVKPRSDQNPQHSG